MINQDDIDDMRPDYLNDPVFQRLQWEVRSAFEQGFRAGAKSYGGKVPNALFGGEPAWRPYWLESRARAFLLANGLIAGDEGFK